MSNLFLHPSGDLEITASRWSLPGSQRAMTIKHPPPLKPKYIFPEAPLVGAVLPHGAAQNKPLSSEGSHMAKRNEGRGKPPPAGRGAAFGEAPALNVQTVSMWPPGPSLLQAQCPHGLALSHLIILNLSFKHVTSDRLHSFISHSADTL